MNKKYTKLIKIFLLSVLIISSFFPFSIADEIREGQKEELQIYSNSVILVDSNTGQVLYESNSDKITYPASTTKLMTAILTVENCKLDDTVTVSQDALKGIPYSYTIANLQPNEKLTVEQLLHVLLIPSANDAANVLAYHISGSVENFTELMNAKAQELGATNTHFENPSGIHSDNHYSTARDMAIIGKYATKFDIIREITQKTECTLPNLPDGTERKFKTTNPLLQTDNKYFYEYATGLKTGYTDKAKSCIVATARKDDLNLLCVVLGGDKIDSKNSYRDIDCHTLFDYGLNNFSDIYVCKKNDSVDLSNQEDIPEILKDTTIQFSDDIHMLVNKNSDLTPKIEWKTDLHLPIEKGATVGIATYTINGDTYTVDLISKDKILPIKNGNVMLYILIGLFGFLIVFIFTSSKHKNKYHKKSRSRMWYER